ncbi:glutamate racemase [Patescibacteria group bacterium]|nr:glutamate racemase [Patescibacteria group bacterium]
MIGFFDSGVGGLAIFNQAQQLLPRENFIYLADQLNCPYGEKTAQQIQQFSLRAVDFLVQKGCRLIVVACNTATTQALELLRRQFPKTFFVGIVPVVKPASRQSKTGHLVILSTQVTQKSQALKELITRHAGNKTVYNLSGSGLVELIEQGLIQGPKITKKLITCLQPALQDQQVDIVAAGCTHYIFLASEIVKLFTNKVKFIEPSQAVVQQLKKLLKENKLGSNKIMTAKTFFFTTGNVAKFSQVASQLLKTKIMAQKA